MSEVVYPQNRFKNKLKSGIVNGMICNSGSPRIIEAMGHTGSGLDYVVIDTEHSPLTLDEKAVHLIRTAELAGLTPLIRLRSNDPIVIGKALDFGCQGCVVTHINSKSDAERVVNAIKFPPIGNRGSGPGRHFGADWKTYLGRWNGESIVMILVESKEGVENLDEIVTVPGIDVIGIGQGDLSLELGNSAPRFENPGCVEAVEKLLRLCKSRGIAVRDIFSDVETAKKWHEKGVRVFEWGFDVSIFQAKVREIVSITETLRNYKKKK